MKKQIIKLTENDLHNIIRNVVKESMYETDDNFNDEYEDESEEEMTPFEEYKNDYPNDEFSKNSVDLSEVLSFIKKSGDFLYYFNGRMHAANSKELVNEIYDDVQANGAILSDKLDSDLDWGWDKYFGIGVYVAVFKTTDAHGVEYYIVYERDKDREPYSF